MLMLPSSEPAVGSFQVFFTQRPFAFLSCHVCLLVTASQQVGDEMSRVYAVLHNVLNCLCVRCRIRTESCLEEN